MGEMRSPYNILVGKPEWKRSLRGPRYSWEDSVTKTDIREIGWKIVDWMYLAQDMDQWWAVVNLWAP
jgi:hypothetical protein